MFPATKPEPRVSADMNDFRAHGASPYTGVADTFRYGRRAPQVIAWIFQDPLLSDAFRCWRSENQHQATSFAWP